MAVDSDDPIALPQAPPPRPAARRAAIEAALRKFDGAEDGPQEPARKPPLWAGWAGMDRRAAGALVTAALIAVVSIPLVLTTVRDNVPPSVTPSPARAPAGQSEVQAEAAARAPRADTTRPSEASDAPVATQPIEQPGSGQSTPAGAVAPPAAKSGQTGIVAAERETSQAPSPAIGVAAPPPPPAPPLPPSPLAQMAEESGTADNIVVTGSRVARSNLESASPMAVIGSEDGLLSQLQAAIRANDRATIIGLVALPLRVNIDGQTLTYRSAQDVESDFDRIFTNRVKQSVMNQRPDTLRSRGKMRGTSRVWFGQTSPNGPVRIREVTP